MGVAGVGKSLVGSKIAARLDVAYEDADAFHPQVNIDKMAAGVPLTDDDRHPWLEAISRWLAGHADAGGVVSCSALRRAYRDVLRIGAPGAVFLHLHGDPDLIHRRMQTRPGHFMPPSLLGSQRDALEPLQDDECGYAYDVASAPDEIVKAFVRDAGLDRAP